MATKANFQAKKELFYELKDKLKCFKCSLLPRPETTLQTCKNRHHVCNRCFEKSKICCKSELAQPSIGLVDEVLMELPYQCKYSSYGCTEICMKDDLLEHEENCNLRRIFCPILQCLDKVGFLDMLDHLDQKHPNLETWTDGNMPKLFQPFKFSKFGHLFFSGGALSTEDSLYHR